MLRIRQLREEKGLSQRALATKIGANPKTVNFWEREMSEPTAGFIIALADVFECTADYVLGREDEFGSVNVQKELSPEERRLLLFFAQLSPKNKDELFTFAEYLKSKN